MIFNKLTLLFGLLAIFSVAEVKSQVKINSPYSRFGLGDLANSVNAASLGMGGTSYSYFGSTRINSKNPASYMGMDSANVLFDFGLNGMMVNTMSTSGNSKTNYFNLNYFKLAFPVTTWYKTSIGVTPFSDIGYQISSSNKIDSIGTVNYQYNGEGGISQLYWGNAFKITKNFSAGFNASYLFGTMKTHRITALPDLANSFNYRITNSTSVRDLYFDFGVLYQIKLNNDKQINIGVIYAPSQKLNSKATSLGEVYTSSSTDYEYKKDTIVNTLDKEGQITIPAKFGGGVSFSKKNKWSVAADISYQNWENYSAFGQKDSLDKSLLVNFGAQYTIKNIDYRIGARYYDSYLTLNNTNIDDFGISFGIGLPLRQNIRSFSSIDLGIEVGRRGTLDNKMIKQEYVRLLMSLSIRNSWFQKVKYQ